VYSEHSVQSQLTLYRVGPPLLGQGLTLSVYSEHSVLSQLRRRRAPAGWAAQAGRRPLPMMAASSCAALVVCVTILVAATTRAPDIATIAGMRQRALRGGDVVGVDLAPQRAYEMLRSGQSESRGWDLKTQPATRRAAPRRDATTPRSSPTPIPPPPTPRFQPEELCCSHSENL
jgi:hypothetical protein